MSAAPDEIAAFVDMLRVTRAARTSSPEWRLFRDRLDAVTYYRELRATNPPGSPIREEWREIVAAMDAMPELERARLIRNAWATEAALSELAERALAEALARIGAGLAP